MSTQLDLLANVEPYTPPEAPSGRQHRLILIALLAEGARGMCGEEAAQRCGIRLASTATTRLEEMADRDRFDVPLVFHSTHKERPTASGRLSYVWWLTDVGHRVATVVLRRENA